MLRPGVLARATARRNIRRVGEVAKLLDDAGVICIAALISPRREERDRVRRLLPDGRFVEIHLEAAPEICQQRAGYGRATRARALPYEPPEAAEIVIRTDQMTASEAVAEILDDLHLAGSPDDFSI